MSSKKKKNKEPEPKFMKCAICTECYEDIYRPGKCVFGGPYHGYIMMETENE